MSHDRRSCPEAAKMFPRFLSFEKHGEVGGGTQNLAPDKLSGDGTENAVGNKTDLRVQPLQHDCQRQSVPQTGFWRHPSPASRLFSRGNLLTHAFEFREVR